MRTRCQHHLAIPGFDFEVFHWAKLVGYALGESELILGGELRKHAASDPIKENKESLL